MFYCFPNCQQHLEMNQYVKSHLFVRDNASLKIMQQLGVVILVAEFFEELTAYSYNMFSE